MQLAGHDLHDGDVAGMAHLLRGQIVGAFAGLGVGQIDFRMDLVRLQVTNDSLGAAHADLRLGNRFGTDLKLRRNMLKNDGCADRDFRRLLVGRNQKPQTRRQQQGQRP